MAAAFVETIKNRIMAADLTAAATAVQETVKEITETGIPYEEGEARPADGYKTIYTSQDEQELRELLKQVGLPNLSALLHFEIFKETQEKTKFVYAPIKSHVVAFKLWVIRNGAQKVFVSSDRMRAGFEHILAHLNPKASDNLRYHLPRFLVTDLAAAGLETRFARCLRDLNPEEQRAAAEGELAHRGLTWDQIYQEIIEPKLRVAIQQSMNAPVLRINEPVETLAQAIKYTKHGGTHEATHFVAGYLNKEMEKEIYKIFIAARDPNHPLHRLYRKNMPRALLAIQKYRVKNKITAPTEETTQLLLFAFVNETLCDSMSMFLMEKTGQDHIYLEYGISLPKDLRALFETYLIELRQRDSEKMMLLFTQEDYDNSGMIRAQRFMGD